MIMNKKERIIMITEEEARFEFDNLRSDDPVFPSHDPFHYITHNYPFFMCLVSSYIEHHS